MTNEELDTRYLEAQDCLKACRDVPRGIELLEECVAQEHPKAQYVYALRLKSGRGVAQNLNAALLLAKKSHKQGLEDATRLLTDKEFFYKDEHKTPTKPYTTFSSWADTEHQVLTSPTGENHYWAGMHCFLGQDRDQDFEEALVHFQQSAALNDVDGCYILSLCYEYGYGTEKNPELATQWKQTGDNLSSSTSKEQTVLH